MKSSAIIKSLIKFLLVMKTTRPITIAHTILHKRAYLSV